MKFYSRTFLLLIATISSVVGFTQPEELWGFASFSKNSSGGSIFKTDSTGNNASLEFEIPYVKSKKFSSTPCIGPNGIIYGTSEATFDGAYRGTLFQYDTTSKEFSTLFRFPNTPSAGINPKTDLIFYKMKLFGYASLGGAFNEGVLFEYDLLANSYKKLVDLRGGTTGSDCQGMTLAKNGKIYCVMATNIHAGTILELNPDNGTVRRIVRFGTNNNTPSEPMTKILELSNGKLIGATASELPSNSHGTIYELDTITNTIIKLATFNGLNGSRPGKKLVESSNGKVYGTTKGSSRGSTSGVIFEFSTITNSINTVHNFNNSFNELSLETTSGKLYGYSNLRNLGQSGIFEFNVMTSSLSSKILLSPSNSSDYPIGELVKYGTKMFGVCERGGAAGGGTFFEYNIALNVFDTIVHGGDNKYGWVPSGTPIQAINGKLYGVTLRGGLFDQGVFFEYDPLQKKYSIKKHFGDSLFAGYPDRGPIQLNNGRIFGLIKGNNQGLPYRKGSIYEYDITSDSVILRASFDTSSVGKQPVGQLTEANGKLYGLASYGGSFNRGTIFEYDLISNRVITNFHFFGSNGLIPLGTMVLAPNGLLYGTTSEGGSSGFGVFFEFNPVTGVYTKKVDFTGPNGNAPKGNLIVATNGNIYGTTTRGGASFDGIIFEYNIVSDTLINKIDFGVGNIGSYNMSDLHLASNGSIYGLSFGTYSYVFEYKPDSGIIRNHHNFKSANSPVHTFRDFRSIQTTQICYPTLKYDSIIGCDSIFYGNKWFNRNDSISDTFKLASKYGCDSIHISVIIINSSQVSATSHITECDKYLWAVDSITYTTSGFYSDTLITSAGCDSIVTLQLTITNSDSVSNVIEGCDSYYWQNTGKTYSSSGLYIDSLINNNGCDSLIKLDLTINYSSSNITNLASCDTFLSPSGKHKWNKSGVYQDTVLNSVGCDSVITVNLTVKSNSTNSISDTSCFSFVSPSGKYSWTKSGLYFDTLTNGAGCDSIIMVNLLISSVDNSISNTSNSISSNAIQANYQWLDCLDNYSPISGETNQSYFYSKSGEYAVEVSVNGCIDTSICTTSIALDAVEHNSGVKNVRIYPNPTSDDFQVHSTDYFGEFKVVVRNSVGALIHCGIGEVNSDNKIAINAEAGVYTVSISLSNNNEYHFRLLKQ